MKLIAIPTRDGMVDDHFGHCAYYTVVTLSEQNQVVKKERLDSPESCDHHDCDHHEKKPVYFVPSFGK